MVMAPPFRCMVGHVGAMHRMAPVRLGLLMRLCVLAMRTLSPALVHVNKDCQSSANTCTLRHFAIGCTGLRAWRCLLLKAIETETVCQARRTDRSACCYMRTGYVKAMTVAGAPEATPKLRDAFDPASTTRGVCWCLLVFLA